MTDHRTSVGGLSHFLPLLVTAVAAAPCCFALSRVASGWGLVAVVIAPAVAMRLIQGKFVVNPIYVLGAMWLLGVSLPSIATDLYSPVHMYGIPPEWREKAALWMYRGWAAFSLVYWAFAPIPSVVSGAETQTFRMPVVMVSRFRTVVAALALAATIGFLLVTRGHSYTFEHAILDTSTLQQVLIEMRALAPLYVYLYFSAKADGHLRRNERIVLIAVLASQFFFFTATGTKAVPLELLGAWALGAASRGPRMKPAKQVLLGAVALFAIYFVFYFNLAYRTEMAYRPSSGGSLGEVVSSQFTAVSEAATDVVTFRRLDFDGISTFGMDSILLRFANVLPFGNVLAQTQGRPPFEGAFDSLVAPVFAVLPRDLLDSKVHFFGSGDFAQLLGWEYGGYSITTVGSFYWAWGYAGIIGGMMGLGALLALLVRLGRQSGPWGLIFQAMTVRLVLMMMDIGIEFQPLIISGLRSFLFLCAAYFVVRVVTPRSSAYIRPAMG